MINNIPNELKDYNQFVVWKFDGVDAKGKPIKVLFDHRTGFKAKSNDPRTWVSFEEAVAGSDDYEGIGFVITADDPFCCIDLDATDDEAKQELQTQIYNSIQGYSEISPSGEGAHLWCRAAIPEGINAGGIEIYPHGRFMTMTGNVCRAGEIIEAHDIVSSLADYLRGNRAKQKATVPEGYSAEQTKTDDDIMSMAWNASNGEKFQSVWNGDGSLLDTVNKNGIVDRSGSAIDQVIVNIIAYYTQNREQVERLWKMSPHAMSRQQKMSRADYVTWTINKGFDRVIPQVDISGLAARAEKILNPPEPEPPKITPVERSVPPLTPIMSDADTFEPVPGLLGEIADYIYHSSPRPVRKIAMTGAIGLMSGICGRAFNISKTGVNQYVLLLANTGVGKESIISGINKLMSAVKRTVPACMDFIGPGEIASPQALIKYLAKYPSIVSMAGEFGLELKRLSAWNATTNERGLRRAYLLLYNRSGKGDVLGSLVYSEYAKNTAPVASPAFSIVGESTPEGFYEALDESMITEGLLPRFTILEYTGKRPLLNKNILEIDYNSNLIVSLSALCAHSLMLNNSGEVCDVSTNPGAEAMFEGFEIHCTNEINNSGNEIGRHLWNRSALKAMKLAALVAVGVNPYNPVITEEHSEWAIKICVEDVNNLMGKFEKGEVGEKSQDDEQIKAVRKVVKKYVTLSPVDMKAKWKETNRQMHADKVLPYKYLQNNLVQIAAFKKDRTGATNALKKTLSVLIDYGELQEVPTTQMKDQYGTRQKAFIVTNVDSFLN
jgi:hypothetical protein